MKKNDKHAAVLSAVRRADGGNILHLGCTDAPFTQQKLQEGRLLHKKICNWATENPLKTKVVGVDINAEGLRTLRDAMPNYEILNLDVHAMESLRKEYPSGFSLIIAGDIIEHLDSPGLFLKACADLLAENGILFISTVNAYGIIRVLKCVFRYEAVHPDHTAFYSHQTIEHLLSMKGFRVTSKSFYRLGHYFGDFNLTVCSWVERILCLIVPLWAEGIVVEATVSTEDN